MITSIVEAIRELEKWEKNDLLVALLDSGIVDFVDFAKMYVKILEGRNHRKECSINTLGLMLGSYCMHDNSPGGKNARRHLYESGAYTEQDGSGFGRMLGEEFKVKENDPVGEDT